MARENPAYGMCQSDDTDQVETQCGLIRVYNGFCFTCNQQKRDIGLTILASLVVAA